MDLVVGRQGSASHAMKNTRAYFSLVRIFSNLIAVGGIHQNAIVTTVETMKQ
jgi:hypothetical protein